MLRAQHRYGCDNFFTSEGVPLKALVETRYTGRELRENRDTRPGGEQNQAK